MRDREWYESVTCECCTQTCNRADVHEKVCVFLIRVPVSYMSMKFVRFWRALFDDISHSHLKAISSIQKSSRFTYDFTLKTLSVKRRPRTLHLNNTCTNAHLVAILPLRFSSRPLHQLDTLERRVLQGDTLHHPTTNKHRRGSSRLQYVGERECIGGNDTGTCGEEEEEARPSLPPLASFHIAPAPIRWCCFLKQCECSY